MQRWDYTEVSQCIAQCSKEFSQINHYWDKQRNMVVAKILPGEFYMTVDHVAIATTLGSCVSACIWDKKTNIGGMNHFMLPHTEKEIHEINWGQKGKIADATRYGNFAMEHLINTILKSGGSKINLRAKIFGGASVINQSSNIGQENTDFAYEYLEQEGIQIEGADVGDIYPRKLIFEPYSGRAFVKKLKTLHNDTIIKRESEYCNKIGHKGVNGDIELF
jgi:chemotaxis protein CheD